MARGYDRYYYQWRAEFLRGPMSDYFTQAQLAQLCRLSSTHARLATEACNGPAWMAHERPGMTADQIRRAGERLARWEKRLEAEQERIERAIVRIAGCESAVRFGGDPRGCTVTLLANDREYHVPQAEY